MKSLAKRACLSEGSAREVEAYKAENTSLTSERADLRDQVRHLSKDVAIHRSDLKHTSLRNRELKNKRRRLGMS